MGAAAQRAVEKLKSAIPLVGKKLYGKSATEGRRAIFQSQ
jgi:hypothetical protein